MALGHVSTGRVEDEWANSCATALRDALLKGGFNEITSPRRDVALDWKPAVQDVVWEGVVLQAGSALGVVDLVVLFRTWTDRPDCLFGWRHSLWQDDASRKQLIGAYSDPSDFAAKLFFEIVEGLSSEAWVLPVGTPTPRRRGLPSESNPTAIIWVRGH